MKYIMLEIDLSGVRQKLPVIFPSTMVHKLVADALIKSDNFSLKQKASMKVVSAGILEFNGFGVTCSGGSETLKVQSRPDDAKVIEMHDYIFGL